MSTIETINRDILSRDICPVHAVIAKAMAGDHDECAIKAALECLDIASVVEVMPKVTRLTIRAKECDDVLGALARYYEINAKPMAAGKVRVTVRKRLTPPDQVLI